MTQFEFSALVKGYLTTHYIEFVENLTYKSDNSFDCSIESPKGMISLWIATYNTEITVGFEDADGKCDWHMHMSQFGANFPEEELKAMSGLISSILAGKEPIVLNKETGYTLVDNLEDELIQPGYISTNTWDEL